MAEPVSDAADKVPVSPEGFVQVVQQLGWVGAFVVLLAVTMSVVVVALPYRSPELLRIWFDYKLRDRALKDDTERGRHAVRDWLQRGTTGSEEGNE